MEKLNFLDEVILDDSEMLEICGGTSDNISCGSNCGNNCGSNCEMIVGIIAEVAPLKISLQSLVM